MQDLDLIFLLKLGEKFGFAELGQCILQQIYTFMREEKLERYLKVERIEPSASWYCKRIFKVGHRKPKKLHLCRELNPDPHAPKPVKGRRKLSSLDFSGQLKICVMFQLLPMMDPVKI